MPLHLEYTDRYRLWHDLVRGSTERLFVPTEEPVDLGADVPVEVRVGGVALPMVIRATVLGRRGRSRRFARGVWVKLHQQDLDRFRRFLGLEAPEGAFDQARRAVRVHHELPVRFTGPGAGAATTRNVSELGLYLGQVTGLRAGERVELELRLPGGETLELSARVVWAAEDRKEAGLELIDVPPSERQRLRQSILSVLDAQLRQQLERPQPVLVADDDPEILAFVTNALSKHGYAIHKARDGSECLTMIRQLHPTLVLMDILMPGMDGAEICKAMRADAELADILVIFLSALEPESLHLVADEAGATDYLCKPLHLTELLDMMATYLSDEAARAART